MVPPMSGVFSAVGMLASDIEHTALKTVADGSTDECRRSAARSRQSCRRRSPRNWRTTAIRPAAPRFVWEADLRHEGQATELTVPFEGEDFAEIRERFVAEYFKTYGYRDETPIELMKMRLVGRGLRESGSISAT